MRNRSTKLQPGWLVLCLVAACVASRAAQADLRVSPDRVEFVRNYEQVQLLAADANDADALRSPDVTAAASYSSGDPRVVVVDATGRVRCVGNGETTIEVAWQGQTQSIPVKASGIVERPEIQFTEQVQPVLYRAGCNAGACHASQYGKGGFTLSVIGYDPQLDYDSITRDARGRRVSPGQPRQSLFLRKPTQAVAHGGGLRLDVDSPDYLLLVDWIAGGAPGPKPDARRVTSLNVVPAQRVLQTGETQQFRVLALRSDGSTADVTAWARFDSTDDAVLKASPSGRVTAVGKGQAQVMARYAGEARIATCVVPYADRVELAGWENRNFIDEFAAAKFRELSLEPSPLCSDAAFLRRAYLDAIGALPTVEAAAEFLDSAAPDKRDRLVDQLLGLTGDPAVDRFNDQYAALWSLKWADLIRNNSAVVGESGMWAMHNWLRESFRVNKPFDQFVKELVTAKGSIFSNGPANYYRIANNPSDLAETTAQLFLGTRLQCAKCHHHPYEKYGQQDYYSFAAFFARISTKTSAEFGNFGGEMVVMVRSNGEVGHPKTGKILKPTALEGPELDDPFDRRVALANWLASPDNEAFSRNVANRYMAYLLGRGLVEPIDDMRSTNPPSNVELMNALARDFRESRFDLKRLMRRIMTSRLYQLDSQPTVRNSLDRRFYSHFRVKRLPAETLLDAVDVATGSLTKHPNLPLGTRAVELPDAATQNPFLVTFGKPKRASVCECERSPDENLAQALHTLNGDVVATKIADPKGRVAKLVAEKRPHDELVAELYLATLSRRPTPAELEESRRLIDAIPDETERYQDLLWALLNCKQFLFAY